VRKNVKTEDAPVFQVLAKVAKFFETGLKIVTNDSTSTDCLVVFTSLMRCVQDDVVQLVVNKNYDKDWASQHKSIMSGQTDVREENINAMDRKATILKHRYTSTSQPTWPTREVEVEVAEHVGSAVAPARTAENSGTSGKTNHVTSLRRQKKRHANVNILYSLCVLCVLLFVYNITVLLYLGKVYFNCLLF
jgi:hypothetical protein